MTIQEQADKIKRTRRIKFLKGRIRVLKECARTWNMTIEEYDRDTLGQPYSVAMAELKSLQEQI